MIMKAQQMEQEMIDRMNLNLVKKTPVHRLILFFLQLSWMI